MADLTPGASGIKCPLTGLPMETILSFYRIAQMTGADKRPQTSTGNAGVKTLDAWRCDEALRGRPRCGVQCPVCEGDENDIAAERRRIVDGDGVNGKENALG